MKLDCSEASNATAAAISSGRPSRPSGTRLGEWFQRAVGEGDLPSYTDTGLLVRYVTTLAFGIAVQAASGVGPDELQDLADAALRTWPLT